MKTLVLASVCAQMPRATGAPDCGIWPLLTIGLRAGEQLQSECAGAMSDAPLCGMSCKQYACLELPSVRGHPSDVSHVPIEKVAFGALTYRTLCNGSLSSC